MVPIALDGLFPIDFDTEITFLKNKLNARILAHYYQDSEIQDMADYVGGSSDLIREALITDCEVIVVCGTVGVAEAISILNPKKKVLVPDMTSGCSLNETLSAPELEKFRKENPEYQVLTHINCSSAVKALSDIIITSSNAEKIILSLSKDKPLLFAPDKNLGNYLINKTGVPMKLWEGACVVHNNFSERDLIRLKAMHPRAKIIAHPQCPNSILEYANHIGSTTSLVQYVEERPNDEFIVLTEPGIIHQMHKKVPDAKFYDVPLVNTAGVVVCNECPFMRLNTLEKLHNAMKGEAPVVTVDPLVMKKACIPLERMLSYS